MDKRKVCESCGHIHMCTPVKEQAARSQPFFSAASGLTKPPPHYLGNPAKQSYFNYMIKTPQVNRPGADFKHGGNGKDTNISFKPQAKKDEPAEAPPEALPREDITAKNVQQEDSKTHEEPDDGRMIREDDLENELISEFNRDPGRRPPKHLPVEPPPSDTEQPIEQPTQIQQSQSQEEPKKKKKWTSYKDWKPPKPPE